MRVLIGHTRVSTDGHDLTALVNLGVDSSRAMSATASGVSPNRPGLRQALATCRTGDILVVTKQVRRLRPVLADARANRARYGHEIIIRTEKGRHEPNG